jgi:Cu+-exporting ATPase
MTTIAPLSTPTPAPAQGQATLDLPVTGMTCANCANTIERTLKKTPGVTNAAVNFANERAQVAFDPAQVKPGELIERVRKAGYDVTLAHADLPLLGMTCANCANTIERTLRKLPGIANAAVNLASERASVDYVPGAVGISDMVAAIRKAGYDVPVSGQASGVKGQEDVEQAARAADIQDRKRRMIVGLAFAIPAFIISMARDLGLLGRLFGPDFAPMSPEMMAMGHALPAAQVVLNWALMALSLPVMIYTAQPFFVHGYKAIRNGAANMDVLVALGSGVAFAYSVLVLLGVFSGHVYFETAAVIVALISVGKYIEAKAKGRTSEAIKRLMNLAPKTARVLRYKTSGVSGAVLNSGQRAETPEVYEVEIPADQINIGDVIVVKPGERIAADGIVIEGRSAVDESMITGESLPRDKKPGDAVIGATVNKEGLLKFEASKVGKDTALANIIRLVKQAQGSKAPIQALADRVSAIFVPAVLVIAALTFLGWLVIGRAPLETALINAIAVLVIACPCALGLATPTAIMVGMGKGAENGILFKNSAALEKAAEINTVVLDKTGTVTQGKPQVTDILDLRLRDAPVGPIFDLHDASQSLDSIQTPKSEIENWFALAASAEKGSEHPLAQAIVQAAETKRVPILPLQKFVAVPGKGLTAYVDGKQVAVGNLALMQQQGVAINGDIAQTLTALQDAGKTAMLVAINNEPAGVIAMSDTIKDGSAEAIEALKQRGVRVVMLTGDNARSARAIAEQARVSEVIADVLPGDKSAKVAALQTQGEVVAMVGDGINDAPALAQADVGMAIGTGTDVAMEAADVTLISGDIRKVPQVIALSQLTVRGIKQNLFWAFIYNVILIPTAILGIFHQYGPILAAAAMAFSSLFVVGNSLRLRSKKI